MAVNGVRTGIEVVSKWRRNGFEMMYKWFRNDFERVSKWCRRGRGMVLKLCRIGSDMGLKWFRNWFRNGVDMGSTLNAREKEGVDELVAGTQGKLG